MKPTDMRLFSALLSVKNERTLERFRKSRGSESISQALRDLLEEERTREQVKERVRYMVKKHRRMWRV